MKINDKFLITHEVKAGVHRVTFSPVVKSEGYPPKTIDFTEDQWNNLKYHFMTAIDDKNEVSKLTTI